VVDLSALTLALEISADLLSRFCCYFIVNLVDNLALNHLHELQPPSLLFEIVELLHESCLNIESFLSIFEEQFLVKEPHLNLSKSVKEALLCLKLI
jgi:hypothetical protein